MPLDRIKNILRANIYEQLEKLGELGKQKPNIDFDWYRRESKFNFDESQFNQKYSQENNQNHSAYRATKTQKSKELAYYRDLEVYPGTSFVQIKKSYRRLVKMYHPDLFAQSPEKQEMARKVTTRINEAYCYFENKNANLD